MLSKHHYEALSDFRTQLAQFLRFSEAAATQAGVTPAQYLLLLHVRGYRGRDWATIGELAERLHTTHQGTVALVKRCVARGYVRKRASAADARCVEIHLTPAGTRLVERIAAQHRDELGRLRDTFRIDHVTAAPRRRSRA